MHITTEFTENFAGIYGGNPGIFDEESTPKGPDGKNMIHFFSLEMPSGITVSLFQTISFYSPGYSNPPFGDISRDGEIEFSENELNYFKTPPFKIIFNFAKIKPEEGSIILKKLYFSKNKNEKIIGRFIDSADFLPEEDRFFSYAGEGFSPFLIWENTLEFKKKSTERGQEVYSPPLNEDGYEIWGDEADTISSSKESASNYYTLFSDMPFAIFSNQRRNRAIIRVLAD